MRLKVFIASSSEAREYAQAIQDVLQTQGHEVVGWWTAFPAGVPYITSIEKAADVTNAALLVASADDRTIIRGDEVWEARDNIAFEHAYFAAKHGLDRSVLITFKDKPAKLPSDVAGVAHLQLLRKKKKDMVQFVELNRQTIQNWAARLARPRKASGSSYRSLPIMAGDIKALLADEITPRIRRHAREIDVLGLYRGIDIYRELDEFREAKRSRLRLCLFDAWDKSVVEMYRRKIKHEPKYFRTAIEETIGRFVGAGKLKKTLKGPCFAPDRPIVADFDVRLTQARITYDYCRVDNVAVVIPLDMKSNQNPPPPAFLLTRDEHPELFAFYFGDFGAMFKDARSVYASRRKTRSSKR